MESCWSKGQGLITERQWAIRHERQLFYLHLAVSADIGLGIAVWWLGAELFNLKDLDDAFRGDSTTTRIFVKSAMLCASDPSYTHKHTNIHTHKKKTAGGRGKGPAPQPAPDKELHAGNSPPGPLLLVADDEMNLLPFALY